MSRISFTLLLVVLGSAPALGQKPVVRVSSVEALYAAVNNPLNAGARVELAAGIYVLTPTDPSGAERPRFGTLLLQENMDLVGEQQYVDDNGDGVWDPIAGLGPDTFVVPGTETKIEARLLSPPKKPLDDCNAAPNTYEMPFPVIQNGRRNRVERLTVSDGAARKSLYMVTPPYHSPSLAVGAGWEGEVADTVIEGGFRGLAFSNASCGAVGFVSRVTYERNIVRKNGGGIYLLNFVTDNLAGAGSSLHVVLRYNRIYGNGTDAGLGLIAGGYGADNSELHALSIGNLIEGNALGVRLTGGSDNAAASGGDGNSLWFASHGDTIRSSSPRGGLMIQGANRTQPIAGTTCSNNRVHVELVGTTIQANTFMGTRFPSSFAADLVFGTGHSIGGRTWLAVTSEVAEWDLAREVRLRGLSLQDFFSLCDGLWEPWPECPRVGEFSARETALALPLAKYTLAYFRTLMGGRARLIERPLAPLAPDLVLNTAGRHPV